MTEEKLETRRVFVSYSWTSPEYREWIRELVDRLRGDGVDVIFDMYKLKEGQDKYAFMETLVTDREVSKVLVISNRRYAEKADAREGGVGTESIIISHEVYDKVDQRKFIPIVTEFKEDGEPYLPTFMGSRIFIDFSSEEKLAENYEALLRNIFDKPLYQEPALGKPPSFLQENERISTRTGSKLKMLRDAVLKGKPTTVGLVTDYLSSFEIAIADFRFTTDEYQVPFGEKVLSSIHRFLPYRDEFIDFILFVSVYVEDRRIYEKVFTFFEGLLEFRNPPKGTSGFDSLADNFRFILREMFLYLIAALIKNQRFEIVNLFLSREYFDGGTSAENQGYVTFIEFCYNPHSLDGDSAGTKSTSLLRERASNRDITFQELMEADFLLYIRSLVNGSSYFYWFPSTVLANRYGSAFKIFARAESHRQFENLKTVLGVANKDELVQLVVNHNNASGFGVGYAFRSDNVKRMINFDNLDTRP